MRCSVLTISQSHGSSLSTLTPAAKPYLFIGARAGEVVLRQVRDVDDVARRLWIPDSKTEGGRRQLAVPSQLTQDWPAAAPLFAHAATRRHVQDWAGSK